MCVRNKIVPFYVIVYSIALGINCLLDANNNQQDRESSYSSQALFQSVGFNIPKLIPLLSYFGADKEKALIVAAKTGNNDAVRALIASGVDINTTDRGYTALILAADQGHLDVIQELVWSGAEVNQVGKHGVTALMAAAAKGYGRIVNFLLQSGANVNRAQNNGVTALLAAAQKGHLEIVDELILAGADPNTSDKKGRVALDMSLSKKSQNSETPYLLLKSGALLAKSNDPLLSQKLLMHAIENNNKEMVDLLTQLGVDVEDELDSLGLTPIVLAVLKSNLDMVKHLIQAGASLSDTYLGATLVEHAASTDNVEMVKLLLENGALPYHQEGRGSLISLTDSQKKLIDNNLDLYSNYWSNVRKSLLEEQTLSGDTAGVITDFYGEKRMQSKK